MAAIATRGEVVKNQSKIPVRFDGHDVVGMQMPLAAIRSDPQFLEYAIDRHDTHLKPAVHADDLRFPAAIDAAPLVPLKRHHPDAAVIFVIAAFFRGAAVLIERSRARMQRAPGAAAG